LTDLRTTNRYDPTIRPRQLLVVPFTLTHAEYIYLQGKRVLADQMKFLKTHFPRRSLMHVRLKMLA